MFYSNYDVQTLFNSLWSWRYPLERVFGLLALVAALGLCFRRLARAGALGLAAASMLRLPVLFLYRVDDFFGDPVALVEIFYSWALDLGLAGGALLVAASLRQTAPVIDAKTHLAIAALRRFFRRNWVRVALSFAAIVFVAAIVLHGLIPTIFYETNARGDQRLGALATRIYRCHVSSYRRKFVLDREAVGRLRERRPVGPHLRSQQPTGLHGYGQFLPYDWLELGPGVAALGENRGSYHPAMQWRQHAGLFRSRSAIRTGARRGHECSPRGRSLRRGLRWPGWPMHARSSGMTTGMALALRRTSKRARRC